MTSTTSTTSTPIPSSAACTCERAEERYCPPVAAPWRARPATFGREEVVVAGPLLEVLERRPNG